MARKDYLTKNKSIYTISRKHMSTNDGTIYEKDHITIIPNDGIYDEHPMFSDSNFKFKIRTGDNERKRHSRGAWIKPSENGSGETWTLSNLPEQVISDETKIVNKPNYSSLKDFAYYGSAIELIKATVNDIILRFPGGLSYYGKYPPTSIIDNETYYLVSNEFEIDFWTQGNVFSGDVKNPLRVLSSSYMNYVNKDNEPIDKPIVNISGTCLNSIIGTVTIAGNLLYVYLNGEGKKLLFTKEAATTGYTGNDCVIIRPNQKVINEFWGSLDDFERVLLNRETEPVYKAEFETPYETETGHYFRKMEYVWPTVGGDNFTPDITTGVFQGYLNSLISLAEYHDTYDSDNIWRMLTHESIKNLDWTFIRHDDEEDTDLEVDIESSRIQALLRIMGRQFDDLKLYTENIKSSNAISYDEKNNVPDYFLSDKANCEGWQEGSVSPTNDMSILSDIISGETSAGTVWTLYKDGKTGSDVNVNFTRRLVLNSPFINAKKGTRRGIDSLLGLFGYVDKTSVVGSGNTTEEGTFNIKEYVSVASRFPNYDDFVKYRTLGGEYLNYEGNADFLQGYPVNAVETENGKYLIPWFDKSAEYKYDIHFQDFGGWKKSSKRSINLPITEFKEISENDDVKIYGETESQIRFASTIADLKAIPTSEVYEGMICYVSDISALMDGYPTSLADNLYEEELLSGVTPEQKEEERFKLYSHYFILRTKVLSQFVGYVNNELYSCYGWRNIYTSEFDGKQPDDFEVLGTYESWDEFEAAGITPSDGDVYSIGGILYMYYMEDASWDVVMASGLTSEGLKVLYQESNENRFEGNNPHLGHGRYDDGVDYIRNYNYLFEKDVRDGVYDNLRESTDEEDREDYAKIITEGFCASFVIPQNEDNKKAHYFKNNFAESGLTYLVKDGYDWAEGEDVNEQDWDDAFYDNLVIPPYESAVVNTTREECAANSVINIKNMQINFGTGGNIYLRKYIEDVVLKYLENMIPSTTIWSYTFDGEELIDDTNFEIEEPSEKIRFDADAIIPDDEADYFMDNDIYENNLPEETEEPDSQ